MLDPACGSGNFLYVALQHLKLLEGEVLDTAAQFGENFKLELETHTIDPHQFLGIELNPRAASIAELVLWIGYLQWHFKIHGERTPPEPILRAFKNIECRDAVLAWDGDPQPALDETGAPITVWDRRSMKPDLVTGRTVPDESKRVPMLTYPGARPAAWVKADYIVGNPPFLGNKRMRDDLGDGYTETLRAAYPDVTESADFVMYWWHKAALLVRSGAVQRFGFITTNSLRQTFNRRVVERHLSGAPIASESAKMTSFRGKEAPDSQIYSAAGPGKTPTSQMQSAAGSRETHPSQMQSAAGSQETPTSQPQSAAGSQETPTSQPQSAAGSGETPTGQMQSAAGSGETPTGQMQSAAGSQETPPDQMQSAAGAQETPQSQPQSAAGGGKSPKAPTANQLPVIQTPLSLHFAIPDHPWVDTVEGAAVRIAMTVAVAGTATGELRTVANEETHEDGSSLVTFAVLHGRIAADLTTGADVAGAVPLRSNDSLCFMGVKLAGDGFAVTEDEAKQLGLGTIEGLDAHIRPFRNGRDLSEGARGIYAIDLFGLSADEVRQRFPAVYQHVLTRVKPKRDENKRDSYRLNWWIFAEPRSQMRKSLAGLRRYIGTSEVSKHRYFTFLDAEILADGAIIGVAQDDAFLLGVLSSRIHVTWALTAGGTLEDRPRYQSLRCFDPYPFPACDESAKARIRALGEELDAHRKRVQAQHPGLSLTAMYNVLEALREERPLSKKEQDIHDRGLVSVLRQLHDELDAAVAAAYGWQDLWEWHDEARQGSLHDFETGMDAQLAATGPEFTAALATWEREFDGEILTRLVALNAARAAEEAAGKIRWLRPDYQAPAVSQPTLGITAKPAKGAKPAKKKAAKAPWPKPLAERVKATEQALREAATAVTPAELAKRFLRAKPEDLAEILETLVAMSRAHKEGEKFSV